MTDGLEFHMVEGERWRDLARLFEAPGGPKYCWCMAWREAGPNRGQLTNDDRKALLAQRVEGNVPIGLLAYLEGEPVGWCSVAPRETLLEGALKGGTAAPGDVVWSIVCFYTPRKRRKSGMGRALLDAAIRVAIARGAKVIEAYPVDPDSPSYRFMGFVSMYAAAGFTEVGRAGTRRHVMRLTLGDRPPPADASAHILEVIAALPGATSGYPFGPGAQVWKVGGKMFALVGEESSPTTVSLKCDPDLAVALRTQYPQHVRPGYHLNKRHWNTVSADLDPALLEEWVAHSYDLVVAALPKRERERLQAR